jgi:SAM-dependent methyltransferase
MELLIAIFALLLIVFIMLFIISMLYYGMRYVPYVPSNKKCVKLMLEAADIKPGQKVYDLGCGDGRLVIAAQKTHGAIATGYEIAPFVYLLAHIRKRLAGSSATIKKKNLFKENLSNADVVFCYLFPRLMNKLKKKFEAELKPGAKVISNAFTIEGWKEVSTLQTRQDKPDTFLIRIYEMGKSNLPEIHQTDNNLEA